MGIGLSALVWGAFMYLFYLDISEKADKLKARVTQMQDEKASYEEKKQKYMAFRAEVTQLLEEQKELVKVLPSSAEIPAFLQSIHAQAELAGLNILTFQQRGEKKKGFYAAIPVAMSIRGTYHAINKFFYSIGQMRRIINISNVRLTGPRVKATGVELSAKFTASTFRFLSTGKKKKKGKKG